ncbi:MAG: hypothetical protein CL398_03320 [Acidiferrobacteraceae bacterium]|nr:hypothetical protein [Acidiferrobacteraceae bacterium]
MMKKILTEWRETLDTLNETTYNRVRSKIEEEKIPFVVMSADRHDAPDNRARNKALKSAVQEAGYPFANVVGSWVEQDEAGNDVRVTENSIIIYDEERGDVGRQPGVMLFDLAKTLSAEFEQDAFIFGEPGASTGKMTINAFDPAGNPVDYGGPWTSLERIPNDANFWSRVRGSTFVFKEEKNVSGAETIEVDAPNSVIEAMIKANEHKGKKIKFVRKKKIDK